MPTVSHSWNASLPIRCVGTWPVMQTSGNRIHQRVGQRRHHVGGAGAGGHQHDAGLAGRARIAFGGVAGALLVPDQDVLDLALLKDLVIDRKHRAAGIAEEMLHAVIDQRADDHRGAGHLVRIVALVAHGLLRMRSSWRGLVRLRSGNKKGPEEAPCAPPEFGWPSATPGDAPGYDDDKEFGNNIAHLTAQTSQRLREHSRHRPNVKARGPFSLIFPRLSGVPAVGECENAAPAQEERHSYALQPLLRRLRLHPFELRQLVPEPGELPLGVVPGVGAADLGGLLQRDLAARDAGSARARHAPSSPAAADRACARPSAAHLVRARRPRASHRNARRCAHRAPRAPARGRAPRTRPAAASGGRPSRCQSVSERPVASNTSSARSDAGAVARLEPLGRDGIAARVPHAAPRRLALQPRADARRGPPAESAASPTALASAP